MTFLQVVAVILAYEAGKAVYRLIKHWWIRTWSF